MRRFALLLGLVGASASAQEEPPAQVEIVVAVDVDADADTDTDTDTEADLEITVWGEAAIRDAEARVIRKMRDLGYKVAGRKDDGSVVFKPPKSYLGRAFLSEFGDLTFGRKFIGGADRHADTNSSQVVDSARDPRPTGTERPDGKQPPMGPVYDGSTQTGPQGTAPTTGGAGVSVSLMPSKRKTKNAQNAVLLAMDPELDRYRRVLRGSAIREIVWALPDRLDALWSQGTPLHGDAPVETYPARRQAVLDYWVNRPGTEEGLLICDAVEDWLFEVVQNSEHPLTADELATATRRRGDGRSPLGQ